MASLSRYVCGLQTGRACAYYGNILLDLGLADIPLRETAFTAGDRVEGAAQRHLRKYALTNAVVAVKAFAYAVKVALLDLFHEVGLNDPLAGQRHKICLTACENIFGDLCIKYSSLGKHRNAYDILNCLCKVCQRRLRLIDGRDHPLYALKYRSLTVECRNAVLFHPLGKYLGLLYAASRITEELVNRPTHDDREILTALCLNVKYQLMQQAVTIFKGAAIFVGAVVKPRGKELGDEVSAYRVNGNGIKSGALAVKAAIAKAIDHGFDLFLRKRTDGCSDEA